VRVRTFAPATGIPEDPVCGSCNATVAAFMARTGLLERVGVDFGMNPYGTDTEFLAGPDDTDRDFTAVGDEDLAQAHRRVQTSNS